MRWMHAALESVDVYFAGGHEEVDASEQLERICRSRKPTIF
jgi:hypothetical protein